MNYDTVFHFDNEPASFNIAFSNITNFIKALETETFSVVLVVNGPGIKLMTKDNPDVAPKITQIHRLGARIKVCNNALRHFDLSPDVLCPECDIVPAGIVEIVQLQKKGFAYIKP